MAKKIVNKIDKDILLAAKAPATKSMAGTVLPVGDKMNQKRAIESDLLGKKKAVEGQADEQLVLDDQTSAFDAVVDSGSVRYPDVVLAQAAPAAPAAPAAAAPAAAAPAAAAGAGVSVGVVAAGVLGVAAIAGGGGDGAPSIPTYSAAQIIEKAKSSDALPASGSYMLSEGAGSAGELTVAQKGRLDTLIAGKASGSGSLTIGYSLSDSAANLAAASAAVIAKATAVVASGAATAAQLLAIDAATSVVVNAGSVTAISGSVADLSSVIASSGLTLSSSVPMTVTSGATVASLNALDTATTGVITASISGSASDLAALNVGVNAYTITVSAGVVTAADLAAVNASTTVAVNAIAVVGITGTAEEVYAVISSGGITLSDDYGVEITGGVTVAQANAIDALTTGMIIATISSTASDLLTLTGSANVYSLVVTDAQTGAAGVTLLNNIADKTQGVVSAIVSGTDVELAELDGVGNDYSVVVNGAATAANLILIDAATNEAVDASVVPQITGSIAQINTVINAEGITKPANWNAVLTDIAAAASDVTAINTSNGTGTVNASTVLTVTGTGAEVAALSVDATLTRSPNWAATISGNPTVADLNTIDAANGTGVIVATVSSDAATLATLTSVGAVNNYTITVTGLATVAQANLIDAATTNVVTASITDSATNLAGLTPGGNNYSITVTGITATAEELNTIDSATAGTLDVSALATVTGEWPDFVTLSSSTGIGAGSWTSNFGILDPASVATLNSLDALTTGVLTASMAGTATQLAALTGTGNAYTLTVTSDTAAASDLLTIAAVTTVNVNAAAATTITGTADQLLSLANATDITRGNWSATVADRPLTVAEVATLNAANGTGVLTATVASGTLAELNVLPVSTNVLALMVTNSLKASDIANLNTLDTKTAGVITATIVADLANLLTLNLGDNLYTVEVVGVPEAADIVNLQNRTDGLITATVTDTAARLANITGTGHTITATVSEGLAEADDLNTIAAATTVSVNATAVTGLTGTVADIKTAAQSAASEMTLSSTWGALIDAGSEVTAADLIILDGLTSGEILLGVGSTITGTAAELLTVYESVGIDTANANATVTDRNLTVAEANAIDAANGTGVLTATVASNTLAALTALTDTGADNAYALTVSGTLAASNIVALNALDNKTTGVITASISADVATLANVTGVGNNYTINVVGTPTVADLNTLDGKTIGAISAEISGAAGVLAALAGTGNAYTATVTDASVTAASLAAIDAATTVAVNASAVTEITGTAAAIKAVADSSGISTDKDWNAAVTAGDVTATDLLDLDDATSGTVTLGVGSTITGSATDLIEAFAAAGIVTSNAAVIVSGTPTIAQLNTIDAATTGVVTASITDTAANLAGLTGTGNSYTTVVTGTSATAANLNAIDAATTLIVDATTVTTVTGAFADLRTAFTNNGTTLQLATGAAATATAEITAVQQAVLDGVVVDGIITASISDTTAAALAALTGTGNALSITMSEATIAAAALNTIDAATTVTVNAVAATTLTGTYTALNTLKSSTGVNLNASINVQMTDAAADLTGNTYTATGTADVLTVGAAITDTDLSDLTGFETIHLMGNDSGSLITIADGAGVAVDNLAAAGGGVFVQLGNGGQSFVDRIVAGGVDSIVGGLGIDNINGGAGDDDISGGGANDVLTGGDGVDIFRVDSGTDTITDFTALDDNLVISAGATAILTGISTAAGAAIINGGILSLTGTAGGDAMRGTTGVDSLNGGDGADDIDGFGGLDTVTGGLGDDTFAISSPLAANMLNITDFLTGTDVLELSIAGLGLGANDYAIAAGDVSTVAEVLALLPGAASNHVIVDTAANLATFTNGGQEFDGGVIAIATDTGRVLFDADGDLSAGSVQIAQITSGLTLADANINFIV